MVAMSLHRGVALATMMMMIIVVVVVAWTPAPSRASTADELWNKYRVNMVSMLQGRFGWYAGGLSAMGANTDMGQTVLHIVTDPVEATWNQNAAELADFAGYVPRWQTSWDASFSSDNSVAERYKQLLFSLADKSVAAQKFVAFNGASKTYEESPHHERLANFAARMAGRTAPEFHFIVEEGSGSTSIGGPWGTHTSQFSHMTSIVRELVSNGQRPMMADLLVEEQVEEQVEEEGEDEEEEEDIEAQMREFIKTHAQDAKALWEDGGDVEDSEDMDNEIESDSAFLFRRRRSGPVIIQQPVFIQSKKFHMDFKATGLIGIPVRAPFVDRHFIRQYRGHFQGNWFGAGGQFCLLPTIVWVAMRPEVVLRVSESEFHIMQQSWGSGRAFGMAVGGAFFRNNNFRQTVQNDVGNEILGDLFGHAALDYMRTSGDIEDEASFQVKSLDANGNEVAADAFDDATFTVKEDSEDDDVSDFAMLASQDQDDQIESDSSFLFRRRRRSPPPPPPPPPQIIEKVYEASFKSNSNVPQVLAITSDIL